MQQQKDKLWYLSFIVESFDSKEEKYKMDEFAQTFTNWQKNKKNKKN
jgi:hypothetical protein